MLTPFTPDELDMLRNHMRRKPGHYDATTLQLMATVDQLQRDLATSAAAQRGHVELIAKVTEERDELISENYWKTPNY
jgi:hypothetical protein